MINSIYKYFPARPEFFNNFLIRATHKAALNDPFEVFPSFDYTVWLVQALKDTSYGDTKEEIEDQIKDLIDLGDDKYIDAGTGVFQDYGIVSLTETRDNLLMWSHYADEHKGFVIEFDYSHLFFTKKHMEMFNDNPLVNQIHRVLYRKERLNELINDNIIEAYFYKSDEWSYEKEHRLLLPLGNAKHNWIMKSDLSKLKQSIQITTQEVNESLVEITQSNLPGELLRTPELMCMFEVPKKAILSVTYGARIPPSIKKNIQENIRKNELDIKQYQAKLDLNDYKLIYKNEA